jgi:hypothetical protein
MFIDQFTASVPIVMPIKNTIMLSMPLQYEILYISYLASNSQNSVLIPMTTAIDLGLYAAA